MKVNCLKCIHSVNEYTQGILFEGCMCEELIIKQLAPNNYDEMSSITECDYFKKDEEK